MSLQMGRHVSNQSELKKSSCYSFPVCFACLLCLKDRKNSKGTSANVFRLVILIGCPWRILQAAQKQDA